jgi:hypothetical protein
MPLSVWVNILWRVPSCRGGGGGGKYTETGRHILRTKEGLCRDLRCYKIGIASGSLLQYKLYYRKGIVSHGLRLFWVDSKF